MLAEHTRKFIVADDLEKLRTLHEAWRQADCGRPASALAHRIDEMLNDLEDWADAEAYPLLATAIALESALSKAIFHAIADDTSLHMAEAVMNGAALPSNIAWPSWVHDGLPLVQRTPREAAAE